MDSFIAIGLNNPKSWMLILAAYIIGSISSAVITCKLMGLEDPRLSGSKNPGATNVLRNAGKTAAIITLIGDMFKGVLPVLIAIYLGVDYNVLALVAFAAFIGHLYPVFLKFKGGKGVATALGVYLALDWRIGLSVIGIWLLTAFVFKRSSLAALVASLCAPFLIWQLTHLTPLIIMSAVLTVMLYWRHRSNIQNLISGKEEKIGKKNK
jgi:glycerol-3-phosphate acyltransferase PlsY